jgi:hypothetical protein
MKLAVQIEGVDVSDAVSATSIEITQNLSDRSSQAHLSFIQQSVGEAGVLAYYDEAHYDQDVYSADVQPMYTLTITDAVTGKLQFGGSIRQIHPDRKRKGLRFSDCDCLDWMTTLDEGYVVREIYTGKTDQDIVTDLILKYAPGITALPENIKSTLTLPTWEIVETSLREALDQITEYTGCEYRIDYSKNFLYFEPADYDAPFALSSDPANFDSNGNFVTWDEATGTWDQAGDITWDDLANAQTKIIIAKKNAGSSRSGKAGGPTWDEIQESWDEIQGSWDDIQAGTLPSYPIDAFLDYKRDAVKIINAATVLGATLPDGNRLRAVYGDWLSQQQYGVHPYVEVNDQIDVGTVAAMRAQAIVEQNGQPQEIISLKTFHDGLEVGQSLLLYYEAYLISGKYLIRDMRMKQVSHSKTEYTLTLGAKETDTLRVLKKIEARSRRNTQGLTAVPTPGSVTGASIGLGGITAEYIGSVNADTIIGTIDAGQIGSVNAAVIAGAIHSSQIGTVNAGTIQGVITSSQIGSIKAAVIEGVIVSQQLADGIIDSVSKMAAPLRTIVNRTSAPALPDPNFPLGGFYYNTVSGFFFRNDGGTWHQVEEGTAVTGKLEYYHIGTIKANKIVGLITAVQIENINASQIVGQINAGQIGTITASSITGQLTASQIATVNASSVQGVLSSAQIGTINASSITGLITASQIGTINAATITIGQIGNSQISGVSAGKLTAGTIDANVITVINLNATNITTGTMSASRIGAGTITASVSINSPLISGGTITGSALSITSAGSSLASGPATFDPTYGALAWQASDSGGATSYFIGRGAIVYQGGQVCASLNRSPSVSNAGEMVIYSGGTIVIFADGSTGTMRATRFQAGGTPGANGSFTYSKPAGGSGTITVTGGLVTSIT